jgi:hypothetical protein
MTDIELDDIGCLGGTSKIAGSNFRDRAFIQACFSAPKKPADQPVEDKIRRLKLECLKSLTGLVPDDIYTAESGSFVGDKLKDWLHEQKEAPIVFVISPVYKILEAIVIHSPMRPMTLVTCTGQYNLRWNQKTFHMLNCFDSPFDYFYDFNKFLFFGGAYCPDELRDWYVLNKTVDWSAHLSADQLAATYAMLTAFNSAHLNPKRLFNDAAYAALDADEKKLLEDHYAADRLTELCEHIRSKPYLLAATGKKKNMAVAPHQSAALADNVIPLALALDASLVDVTVGDWMIEGSGDNWTSHVAPNPTGKAVQYTIKPGFDVSMVRDILWSHLTTVPTS